MGRMTWFKMFVNFDDPERWTSKADNEELGAWVRLLRLASISPVKGKIEIVTAYHTRTVKKVSKSGITLKMGNTGGYKTRKRVIIIEKWEINLNRQKPYRQVTTKVTNDYSKSDP